MRKSHLLLLGSLCFAGTFGLNSARWLMAQLQTQPAAFTAIVATASYKPDGSLATSMSKTYAVRSDGQSVEVAPLTDPKTAQIFTSKFFTDLNTATQIMFDGRTGTVTRRPMQAGTVEIQRNRQTECTRDPSRETGQMLGYPVVRVITSFPKAKKPNGDEYYFAWDEWQAPALNCYPLSRTETFYTNGKPGSRTVSLVKKVLPGEPVAELFAIPEAHSQ